MWKNYDVDEGKEYTVALCQSSNGRRYFDLVEIGTVYANAEMVAMTAKIPYDLLFRRDFEGIVSHSNFINGMQFGVDPHGIWLTSTEIKEFQKGISHDQIKWLNGIPPNFAPA